MYNRYNISQDWEFVNDEYKELINSFCEFLKEEGRSLGTIGKYEHNLKLFGVWMYRNLNNKPFHKIELDDFELWFKELCNSGMSTNRMRVLKSTLSSLSNYCAIINNLFVNKVIDVELSNNDLKRKTTRISEEQYDVLIQYLIIKQMWRESLYVYLAYNTNIKKSNIVELNKCDLSKFGGNILFNKIVKEWIKQRVDDLDAVFVTQHKGEWRRVHATTLNEWCIKFSKVIGVEISPMSFKIGG